MPLPIVEQKAMSLSVAVRLPEPVCQTGQRVVLGVSKSVVSGARLVAVRKNRRASKISEEIPVAAAPRAGS